MTLSHFSELIRNGRSRAGLSQVQLASRSGISLPTLQNLESGRGNPSLEVISKLLAALGLSLKVESLPIDWEGLIACGLPLQGRKRTSQSPTAEFLRSELIRACAYVVDEENGNAPEISRKKVAVQSLLLAISIYYPKTFKKDFSNSMEVQKLIPKKITGPMIKLKRISGAILSGFL